MFIEEEIKNLLKEEEENEKYEEEQAIKSTTDFFNEVVKETRLPEKTVRRILLQLQAALYKSDGSNTAFVEKYSVKYELPSYSALVDFLKDVKTFYRSDKEIEAFSMLNELQKSQIGVLGAQVNRTFYEKSNISDVQKAIKSSLTATSFVHNITGTILENLRIIEKIAEFLDEYKDILNIYVAEQEYIKGEEDEKDIYKSSLNEEASSVKKELMKNAHQKASVEDIKKLREERVKDTLENLRKNFEEYIDILL